MTNREQPWSGAMEQQEEEDLPQMDGSCDACEPDEAQPATQVCHTCAFAFCPAHAVKHAVSTRHLLSPYSQEGAHTQRPGRDRDPGEGAGPEAGEEAGVRLGLQEQMKETLSSIEASVEEIGSVQAARAGEGDPGEEAGHAEADGGVGEAGGGAGEAAPEPGRRDTVTVERLRCKEHGQEGSLYCKPDEKVICVVCAVQGQHSEHEIITLHEAYAWQKSREGYDLLGCTQKMADKIKTKWTNPEMSTEQLEAYVNGQFDELHRLVRLEEKRTLHLVDLKEAFLTAAAAEKIAEISVHTERLQEEMACITQQLGQLDQAEKHPGAGVGAAALAGAPGPGHRPMNDIEARPSIRAHACHVDGPAKQLVALISVAAGIAPSLR
ncbi:tripartite motif-containing protein 44-like [Osmerus eperlanus]|uniref:tripartite motif-containing protein 44-like n=1 Tax=Osmerus eperlanus TaxID=29151 RepID=UPI002E0FC455